MNDFYSMLSGYPIAALMLIYQWLIIHDVTEPVTK